MKGFSLAHYRIDEELGRGGMGIVYKATDTKLNRTVAIKVLPPAALSQEGDRARFFREAQSAAALSHPNVCHVYGVDEAIPVEEGKEPQPGTDSRLFIAMEFIEGQTLQDYIRDSGPMKLTEAVAVASQVAEALKAAHAKDIVHRDIKSANVMITADGIAKVLDFGLAKTNQSTQLTRMGSTMGTVAYMSPEQARGQEVDGRTDLYSLGTMMYEMIAGRLPFDGEYEQAVVYSILNESPEPLTSLRTGVPMQLEWIVNKLLSKDADYRYQSAAGLLSDLKSVDLSGSGTTRRSMVAMTGAMPAAAETEAKAAWWKDRRVWGVAAAVLLVGAIFGWMLRPAPDRQRPIVQQFTFDMPEVVLRVSNPAISPTGRYWAYTTFQQGSGAFSASLILNDTRQGTMRKLNQANTGNSPQFSPSGRWISWFERVSGTYRMRLPAGSPIWVDSLRSLHWLDDDEMLRVANDSLVVFQRVSVESGIKTPITITGLPEDTFVGDMSRVGESARFVAEVIPRSVAFTDRYAHTSLYLIDVSDGSAVHLLTGAINPVVFREDVLLYQTQFDVEAGTATAVAQQLDTRRGRLTGIPVDVLPERVVLGEFLAAGGNDVLLFMSNPQRQRWSRMSRVVRWEVESGRTQDLDFPEYSYDRLAMSPDGQSVVVEIRDTERANIDLYLFDLQTGTERQFTYTFDTNRAPQWSADGKIYWAAGVPDESDIYVKNADGTGSEDLVVENADFPNLSADGQWLAFSRAAGGRNTLWAVNLSTGEEIAVDTTATRSGDAFISPSGRYITYSSSSSGMARGTDQRTVVRSFPDPDQFYLQVTQEFSDDPFFSLDGNFLYYKDPNSRKLMRMGVSTEGSFSITSAPEEVLDIEYDNARFAQDPITGDLIYVDDEPFLGQDAEAGPRVKVNTIFGFSRYLDNLFGDDL